jgi:hypothetical protein
MDELHQVLGEIQTIANKYKGKPYKLNTDFKIMYKTKEVDGQTYATFTDVVIPTYMDGLYLLGWDAEKMREFLASNKEIAFYDENGEINFSHGTSKIFKIGLGMEMYGRKDTLDMVITIITESIRRLFGTRHYTLTVGEVD